jgi:hypothetical protein
VTAADSRGPVAVVYPALRGLDAVNAGRRAGAVLAAVPWGGRVLDPNTTPAGDFLSRL